METVDMAPLDTALTLWEGCKESAASFRCLSLSLDLMLVTANIFKLSQQVKVYCNPFLSTVMRVIIIHTSLM